MAIILDINSLPEIFSKYDSKSHAFNAVKNWIFNLDGRITYGGSKYNTELTMAFKYLKLISELKKRRQVLRLNDIQVDAECVRIKSLEISPDFDDEHLIAISIISRSRLICTFDERSFRFIKADKFYPSKNRKPKIIKFTTRERDTLSLLRKYGHDEST